MKNNIMLIVKGFILGIANIIPGVSGGTLAITLGIYEELINTISHIFSNFKKNLKFLIPIGIGAVLSVLLMSKLVTYSLDKFPIPTTLFFIGLIVGGIPLIFNKVKGKKKEIKNMIGFLIPFVLVIIMAFMKDPSNVVNLNSINPIMFLILFIVGVIAAATMVIPGVSGSFVLMLIGFYKPIMSTISKLTDFSLLGHNISVLLPFGIGIIIGIIGVAKLIEYLLSKHELLTYHIILGFITASIISLFMSLSTYNFNIGQILVGIVLFIVGTVVGYKLGDE